MYKQGIIRKAETKIYAFIERSTSFTLFNGIIWVETNEVIIPTIMPAALIVSG